MGERAGAAVPVGRPHVLICSVRRALGGAAMGKRAGTAVPVGRGHVRSCSGRRAPEGRASTEYFF